MYEGYFRKLFSFSLPVVSVVCNPLLKLLLLAASIAELILLLRYTTQRCLDNTFITVKMFLLGDFIWESVLFPHNLAAIDYPLPAQSLYFSEGTFLPSVGRKHQLCPNLIALTAFCSFQLFVL